jgi:hypothetical protein
MKFSLLSTAFLMFSTVIAQEQIKYSYKENSNQAFTSSYWQVDPCIDINYFSLYATDGFFKQTGSKKTIIKSVSGDATYYTDCKSTGATRTTLSFYSTEPVTGLVFSPLTNVTIKTNITAFFSKSQCIIQSFEYPDFNSGESFYSYYVCGDEFDSGTQELTINTLMNLPAAGAASSVYSSNNKGINRGPGYFEKYESKSKCKSSVVAKNIIKLGKKAPFDIPNTEFTNTGEICKVSSGSSQRYLFTDV